MAKLKIVYEWNGEPDTFTWCHNRTTDEVEDKIHDVLTDGCVRVPSATNTIHTLSKRTIYVIPASKILRFVVELQEGEACPDPHD